MTEYVYIVSDGNTWVATLSDLEGVSIFVKAYFEKYFADERIALRVERRKKGGTHDE